MGYLTRGLGHSREVIQNWRCVIWEGRKEGPGLTRYLPPQVDTSIWHLHCGSSEGGRRCMVGCVSPLAPPQWLASFGCLAGLGGSLEGPIPGSFVLYLRSLPDMVLGQKLDREWGPRSVVLAHGFVEKTWGRGDHGQVVMTRGPGRKLREFLPWGHCTQGWWNAVIL